jgi:hypothetical protein
MEGTGNNRKELVFVVKQVSTLRGLAEEYVRNPPT